MASYNCSDSTCGMGVTGLSCAKCGSPLEHNDLVTLVQKSLNTKNINFDIFYGVSNNSWRYWDISHSSKILGYIPKYNAEEYRK